MLCGCVAVWLCGCRDLSIDWCCVAVWLCGCPDLSIDAMDVSGEQQIDMSTNLLKQRLDSLGNPLNESPQEESEWHFNLHCLYDISPLNHFMNRE